MRKNLEFRREIIKLCVKDEGYAKEIRRVCKADVLFYLNTFAWTYNPFDVGFESKPFITRTTYQDYLIMSVVNAYFEGHDLYLEKSREMGGTWCVIYPTEWIWHFYESKNFLFVSRTEDCVEKKEDPQSLFWKFDFQIKNLPKFLQPIVEKTDMHRRNLLTGSVCGGESTQANVARSGRYTGILLDEFSAVKEGFEVLSSTQYSTKCRIFLSTHLGVTTAFYSIGQTEIESIKLHWTLDPAKTVGLYRWRNKKLEILDKEYKFPSNFEFKDWGEGKYGSVYYNYERKRCVSDKAAAQELDICPFGSGNGFFDAEFLNEVYIPIHCCNPWFEGELVIDDVETFQAHFEPLAGGRLKLWITVNSEGRLNEFDEFGIAADISAGTGASNSVMSVGRLATGEKVAEWCNNKTSPEKLALIAVCLAKMFNRAFMIWEMNGSGHIFCNKLLDDYGYDNIYYRQNDTSITKKVTDLPGWWNVGDNKLVLLGVYRNALAAQKFINHCRDAVKELLQFIYTAGGVEHESIANKTEDSESKKHHGDRGIADALLQKLFDLFDARPESERKKPDQCMAKRNELFDQLNKRDEDGWG
jgi:hypothetical protein